MNFTVIGYEVADGVARLTMNRPDKMNAINSAMHDELMVAVGLASGDEAVRVLLVTGAGERAFCAGLDLQARGDERPMDRARVNERNLHPDRALTSLFIGFEKPMIAAVNGVAAGGGLAIALAADIILAAETARCGAAHVKLGLPVLDMLGYLCRGGSARASLPRWPLPDVSSAPRRRCASASRTACFRRPSWTPLR
jgi:enoyl-CoA hydratase/carnithine racemase